MRKNYYTEEYTKLLEDTLTLINQKQFYLNKLISEDKSYDRDTYKSNVNEILELINEKRSRLEELKKLIKPNLKT